MPVCVFVYRNPLEVADSLKARDGFPRSFGLALWEAYVVASLRASRDLPHVFISYNRLMQDPIKELEGAKAALDAHGVRGLQMPPAGEIQAFLDDGLYRQRESLESFNEFANSSQMRLYAALEEGVYESSDEVPELSPGSRDILLAQESLIARKAKLESAEQELSESASEIDRLRVEKQSLEVEILQGRARFEAAEAEAEDYRGRVTDLEGRLAVAGQDLGRVEAERDEAIGLAESHRAGKDEAIGLAESRGHDLERVEAERNEAVEVAESHGHDLERVGAERNEAVGLAESRGHDLERAESEKNEVIEVAELRRSNDLLRQEFFTLHEIAVGNQQDAIWLADRLQMLDKDLGMILSSRRWKTGKLLIRRILRPLFLRSRLSSEWVDRDRAQARAAVESWKSRSLPASLFRSLPDKSALADVADLRAARSTAEFLAQHVPKLRADAQASSDDVRELYAHAERLTRGGTALLDSSTWKVGDFLVNNVAKRALSRSNRNYRWAPDEIRTIGGQLSGVGQEIKARHTRLVRHGLNDRVESPAPPAVNPKMPIAAPLERTIAVPLASRQHTVIVPIHNAYDEVRTCIESLLKCSDSDTSLLLLDDASTDERIWPLLSEYGEGHSNVRTAQNEMNLGFAGTLNRGLKMASGDVVILNSDTEVTPRWLDKLEDAAYSKEQVATVTPLTNSGSDFAVIRNNGENKLPEFMTPEMVNAAVEALSTRIRPEAPTGNGFCMYIRRDALDVVGGFDEEAFPRGYGEENDFCLRASAKGFIHLVDDATFVYHSESASFLEDKQDLRLAGRKILNERYPGYDTLMREWVGHDPLTTLRKQMEELWNGRWALPTASALVSDRRKTALFLVHDGSGGSLHHLDDIASAIWQRYRCLRLQAGGQEWRLAVYNGVEYEDVDNFAFDRPWNIAEDLDAAREDTLKRLLDEYTPDLVHIHHLLGSAPEIIDRFKAYGSRVVFSFHDFYSVCPSFHLLDHDQVFCSGHCTPGNGDCSVDIAWAQYPNLKHEYVNQWRERIAAAIEKCDRLVSFSEAARSIVVDHFPALDNENHVVIPHGQDLSGISRACVPPDTDPIRVLLLGSLGIPKGIKVIDRIMEINGKQGGPFQFHFVGSVHPSVDPTVYGGVLHGPYRRDNLSQILNRVRPSFAIIASICPETFSYTLSECWAAGLPVLVSNLGAQKERVEATGGGWLLDPSDPEAWYTEMLRLARDTDAYAACVERVKRISLKSLASMGQDYAGLYASTLPDAQAPASSAFHENRSSL